METKAFLLDAKAKRLAKTLLHTEGEILTTLMEMSRARVFAELNYTGIFDYCLRALNFSEQQAFYFKKVGGTAVFFAAIVGECFVFVAWLNDIMAFLWLNVIGCLIVMLVALILQQLLPRLSVVKSEQN